MASRSRLLTSTPVFVVSDLERALRFYCDRLGFGEPSVWGEPPCFAMLYRDGKELMLSRAEGAQRPSPQGASGVWDLYLRVADLAQEIEALQALGVAIAKGPRDMPYQMREIEVLDPDGYRVCLAMDTSHTVEAWHGVLDVGAKQLRVVLRVRTANDGAVRAELDSPDQGAMGLVVDVIGRAGNSAALRDARAAGELRRRARRRGQGGARHVEPGAAQLAARAAPRLSERRGTS